MIHRLKIIFSQSEYSGLLELAGAELRQPDSQVRHIVRKELKQQGLLPDSEEIQSETTLKKVNDATTDKQ